MNPNLAEQRRPPDRSAARRTRRGAVILAATLLALALAPVIASAQSSISELPHGVRLRVQSPSFGSESLVGRLAGVRGDTLLLEQATSPFVVRSIPVVLDPRCRVEVSLEQSTFAPQGAALGAGLGLVFGLFVSGFQSALESLGTGEKHREDGPILAGLAIGAIAGVAMGSAIPRDRWAPVAMNPSPFGLRIEPLSGEQVGVALPARF